MSVKINYKGSEILSLSTDTAKKLTTRSKYCEDDFEIINTQDGGGNDFPLPVGASKQDAGSFNLVSDTPTSGYAIPHNLGEAPNGIVIWTEGNPSGETYAVRTVVFMLITADGDTGLIYQRNTNGTGRYSSYAYTAVNMTSDDFEFTVSANYYKANATYKWLAWT